MVHTEHLQSNFKGIKQDTRQRWILREVKRFAVGGLGLGTIKEVVPSITVMMPQGWLLFPTLLRTLSKKPFPKPQGQASARSKKMLPPREVARRWKLSRLYSQFHWELYCTLPSQKKVKSTWKIPTPRKKWHYHNQIAGNNLWKKPSVWRQVS